MFFFSKKYNLCDSNIFEGWTDCHSHILPGVDDGIHSINDAINVLKFYEEIGIKEVWLTPHIMEDIPNEPQTLKEQFAELKIRYEKESPTSSLTLYLSAENMIDSLFVKRLETDNILTYGKNNDELLVETSYAQAPYRFKLILQEIRKKGLTPVLAHPERYRYMDYDEYYTLHEQGVRFQLNITSLTGAYGPEAKYRAEYLLQEDLYTYQGSDLHSLNFFKKAITEKKINKRVFSKIKKEY